MKKSLHCIPLIILLALFAGSCKTSLMKRHYRNGYFVEHKHKQNVTRQSDKQEVAAAKKISAVKNTEIAHSETKAADLNKGSSVATKEAVKEQSTEPTSTKEKALKLAKKANDMGPVRINESRLRAAADKQSVGMDGATSNDALSLFWVVLLVILILYLLGFAFDGYGLGALVHLLIVIFLILLILWLLRVI